MCVRSSVCQLLLTLVWTRKHSAEAPPCWLYTTPAGLNMHSQHATMSKQCDSLRLNNQQPAPLSISLSSTAESRNKVKNRTFLQNKTVWFNHSDCSSANDFSHFCRKKSSFVSSEFKWSFLYKSFRDNLSFLFRCKTPSVMFFCLPAWLRAGAHLHTCWLQTTWKLLLCFSRKKKQNKQNSGGNTCQNNAAAEGSFLSSSHHRSVNQSSLVGGLEGDRAPGRLEGCCRCVTVKSGSAAITPPVRSFAPRQSSNV